MLSSRFAGIPISSSTIDETGVPQLLNRGEQTMRAVTGSGGRFHFGMVAYIKSERWPTSNRNGGRHQIGMPGRIASEFAASRANEKFARKIRSGIVSPKQQVLSAKMHPRSLEAPVFPVRP